MRVILDTAAVRFTEISLKKAYEKMSGQANMSIQQITENKRAQSAVLTITVAHLSHNRAHVKFDGANTVRFAAFSLL